MITKNSNNNSFIIQLEGDAGVSYDYIYTGNNIGLHIDAIGGLSKYDVMVYDGSHSYTQTYYSDAVGSLSVNLRNVVLKARAAGVGLSCWIRIDSEVVATSVTDVLLEAVYINGGISYNDIWAPYGRECTDVLSEVDDPHIITPPNVIWTVDGGAIPLTIESNVETVNWREIDGGGNVTAVNVLNNTLELSPGSVALRAIRDAKNHDWHFKTAGPCDTMMALGWQSRTGQKKTAFFPVVTKITDISSLDLDTVGNGFAARKNRQECYRCRLDGLTPYSLWYYQDLLFSPVVYATLDPQDIGFLAGSSLYDAVVIGDTSEIKGGYDLRSFEFIVKLRHYDQF